MLTEEACNEIIDRMVDRYSDLVYKVYYLYKKKNLFEKYRFYKTNGVYVVCIEEHYKNRSYEIYPSEKSFRFNNTNELLLFLKIKIKASQQASKCYY